MTILIVDEEVIVRNYLRNTLAARYHALEASTPVEAIETCRTHRDIELVICDADMGLVSGMELASLLRAWIPKLRTILTTDVACEYWTERQNTELKELPTGEVLILEKPFTPEDLRRLVHELCPAEVSLSSHAA